MAIIKNTLSVNLDDVYVRKPCAMGAEISGKIQIFSEKIEDLSAKIEDLSGNGGLDFYVENIVNDSELVNL